MKIACFLSLLVQSNVRDLNKLLYALADGPGHHLPDHERCCLCLDLKGCQPSFLQRTYAMFKNSRKAFANFSKVSLSVKMSQNASEFLTELDDVFRIQRFIC